MYKMMEPRDSTYFAEAARDRMVSVHKGFLFSFAGPVFLWLQFFRFVTPSRDSYLVFTSLSLAIGFLFLIMAAFSKRPSKSIFVFIFTFLVLAAITALARQIDDLTPILFFLSHIGFAWAMLLGRPSHRVALAHLLVLIGFFYFQIVFGYDPELVFVISRNYISVVLILAVTIYFFSCVDEEKNPSALVLLAVTAILFWAIGRAGILSGLLLLLGTFLISNRRYAASIAFLLFLAAAGSTIFENALLRIDLTQFFSIGIDRFERLAIDGHRNYINSEYWGVVSSDITALLFGAPIEGVRAIAEVDGNPHNSVISLHILTGLAGVLLMMWLLAKSFFVLLRRSRKLVALALFVAVFRSFFDSTAFQGQLDVPILFAVFLVITGTHRSTIDGEGYT